jgi:hypothetical protein
VLADTTRRLEPLPWRVGKACALGLLLAGLIALVSPVLAQGKGPGKSREAAAAAHRLDLQTDLPRDAAAGAVKSLDLQTDLPRELATDSGWHFRLPAEVFWIVLIVGLAALLYAFWDELPIWGLGGRRDWSDGAEEGGALDAQAPEVVAAAADELARQGRFGEAMHALLLQSLADVRRRLDEQFADSLTSREILRNTKLPGEGREPLREIIARVERTHFGEYAAGPQDYRACRDRFAELERALHAAAPA